MKLLKNIKFLYLFFAVISWMLLSVINVYEQIYINVEVIIGSALHPHLFKAFILNIFLLCTYLYIHQFHKGDYKNENYYGSLWKAGAMSLACLFASMSLTFLIYLLKQNTDTKHTTLYSIFYQIDFGLLVVFLLTLFSKWKQLIINNSSTFGKKAWSVFEYMLLTSLVFHFVHFEINTIFFISFGVIFIFGLCLSFNLGWISQLNSRQKLTGLFILAIVLVIQGYFFIEIIDYAKFDVLATYTVRSTFFIVIYAFTATYSIVAVLGLLFNLPTASAFEKKINQLTRFQEFNQAALNGDNEMRVYELLLDSALQTTNVQAAWLEMEEPTRQFITKNISEDEVVTLQHLLMKSGYKQNKPKRFSAQQVLGDHAENFPFNSFLCMPLASKNKFLGTLVLLKKIENAFDSMMIASLKTFASEASLAIYNFRLIADAISNQRYREELEIAHKVVNALVPKTIPSTKHFNIAIRADSAHEVGGDYHDYYRISESKHAIIIADVAGKGTSAAFNMAQMKGIFHSLVRLDLSPDLFFEYANAALSSCLSAKSFITASYLSIDTDKNYFLHARAGHCPTLYYQASTNKLITFDKGGLGLGILRNKRYAEHIDVERFYYQSGDLMLLYTDGIVEARHPKTLEEYDYSRLSTFLSKNHHLALEDLSSLLIQDVKQFIESDDIGDDYTVVLVRFT